jgi:hypothetical protein
MLATVFSHSLLEIAPIIIAFITGIAGPLLITYFKHHLSHKNKEMLQRKKDFISSLETQDLINNNLNKLQTEYNLDRIWIAQFHNGGNFYPGMKSMKKLSVTFESTAPGVAADIMKMQNLPVSFFSSILQKLNNGGDGIIVDIDTEEDYALKSFWETKGVNTVYVFPIRCLESGFIAILAIDFIKKDGFITKEVFDKLKIEAHLLSGYVAAISIDKT